MKEIKAADDHSSLYPGAEDFLNLSVLTKLTTLGLLGCHRMPLACGEWGITSRFCGVCSKLL